MVSSLISYSGRREIVPRGADAVGGEDMAKVSETAIQGGVRPAQTLQTTYRVGDFVRTEVPVLGPGEVGDGQVDP